MAEQIEVGGETAYDVVVGALSTLQWARTMATLDKATIEVIEATLKRALFLMNGTEWADVRLAAERRAGTPMAWTWTGARCENNVESIPGSTLSLRRCEGMVITTMIRAHGQPQPFACTHCDWTDRVTQVKP